MEIYKDGKVNNEIDAYLLGFLYADGCLASKYKGQYTAISVSLSSKDKEFLESLAKILETKVVTRQQGKYTVSQLYKYSKELANKFVNFGFTNTKSYDQVDIIQHIPPFLIHHFIRGYFDGDGSIFACSKNPEHATHSVGFVGMNKILFNQLSVIFSSVLNRKIGYFLEKNKYYRLRIKGNPSLIKIREYLYKDATISLNRKKAKFDKLAIYNGNTSGTVGLSYSKNRGKWVAKRGAKYLGIFLTKEEAVAKLIEFDKGI